MNILISGDFFIADEHANKKLFDQSVVDLFQQADYRIINLEAPFTASEPKNKIFKTGPHLRMKESVVKSHLKQLKVDAVALANNHILDYGDNGLTETLGVLKKSKINYVGAGNNITEAAKPLTLEGESIRIAILNFCENEWSIAEEDKPGANPLDIIDNINQIKVAKATHDKVICIIHGGHEYSHLPSPRMVKQYRFYVDNGADAIVGHHTHCIGGYEVYNDVPIIYSLGNFLFTLPSKREEWYVGYLVQLSITKEKPVSFEIFPTLQEKETFTTKLFQGERKQAILKKIGEIKIIIAANENLHETWNEFLYKKEDEYLKNLSPLNSIPNRYIRAGLRLIGINKIFVNKSYLKLILNLIRCEAHYDVTKEIIKRKLNHN